MLWTRSKSAQALALHLHVTSKPSESGGSGSLIGVWMVCWTNLDPERRAKLETPAQCASTSR
jgi:hypothetical protein